MRLDYYCIVAVAFIPVTANITPITVKNNAFFNSSAGELAYLAINLTLSAKI